MILIFYFYFLLCCPQSESSLSAVLAVGQTVFDIVKTGLEIVDLIRNIESDQSTEKDKEEILNRIDTLIKFSTTTIIKEIELQRKLERIEETAVQVQSLLTDLTNYISADKKEDREIYKKHFIHRFHDAVAQIRNLPNLLTDTITTGLSERLVDLILDKTQCNMTAVFQFQTFFAYLTSDCVTLHLAFTELSNITTDDVILFWEAAIQKIQFQFDKMEDTCKRRFSKYATNEIKLAINADVLSKSCKERYTWAWCDVFYYAAMGTHQFQYRKSVANFSFWNGASSSGRNQVMVIGDNDQVEQSWNQHTMNSELKSDINIFKDVISGPEDTSAALKVGEAVETYVKDKGFHVMAVLVFFDAADLEKVSIITDPASPAAYLVIEGVTLKYCYNSGFVCTITRWNLFAFNNEWKEYTGRFHVLVFPCAKAEILQNSRPDCFNHYISSAKKYSLSLCVCFSAFLAYIIQMIC